MPKTIEPQLATLVDAAPAGRRLDPRAQARRLSPARPDRARQGAADDARRARLDRSLLAARGGAREAAARRRAPRRRGGGARRARAIELPGAAGSVEREPDTALSISSSSICSTSTATTCAGYPLLERKRPAGAAPRPSTHQPRRRCATATTCAATAPAFFERACDSGVEGVVSKRADARYESGRTRTWLKTKCTRRQELVVVGWSEPSGSRVGLGALLLGAHDDEGVAALRRQGGHRLRHQDAGATARAARSDRAARPRRWPDAPRARGVHWVSRDWWPRSSSPSGRGTAKIRHPRFVGLREDKKPSDVRFGAEVPVKAAAAPARRPRRSPRGERDTASQGDAGARRDARRRRRRRRSSPRSPACGSRTPTASTSPRGRRRHQERARAVLRAHGRPRAARAGAPPVEPGALPREPTPSASTRSTPTAASPKIVPRVVVRKGARRTRWSPTCRR